MRIAAHLGVMDEVELIASAIEHLYRVGVDDVIVFDMGSSDGTLEILERYRGPQLELVRLSNDTSWDELRHRTEESVRRVPADWVLFLDADEFWLPATGSLRDCVALAEHDIVTVDRFNVVATDANAITPAEFGPDDYERIFLYTRSIENFRAWMQAHPDTPLISSVPVPKVIGRIALFESVSMGGHDIVARDDQPVRRTTATDVVIAHLAVSGLARFQRRAANITQFFEQNSFPGTIGWRWKRVHDLALQGRINEEYERQFVDKMRLGELIANGSVQSAAQVLAARAR